jgi:glycerol-3-phosphate O-acyltransferase
VEKDREALAETGEARLEERRRAVRAAGLEICRRLNRLATPGRTNVVAAVLLAAPGRGVRREALVARARRIVALCEALGVPSSEALRLDLEQDLAGAVASLEAAGHLRRLADPHGEIVWYEEAATDALDYYRSGLTPLLALGGVLSLTLDAGLASSWLDWLRLEFLPPEGAEREVAFAAARRAIGPGGDPLFGNQVVPALVAYEATFRAVAEHQGQGTRAGLEVAGLAAIRSAILLGSSRPNEAANRALVANALQVLVDEGVLELEQGTRRTDPRLRPGPAWARLEPACALLAKGIPAG